MPFYFRRAVIQGLVLLVIPLVGAADCRPEDAAYLAAVLRAEDVEFRDDYPEGKQRVLQHGLEAIRARRTLKEPRFLCGNTGLSGPQLLIVKVIVDPDGRIEVLDVVRAEGLEDQCLILLQLQRSLYLPRIEAGEPVAVERTFVLRGH